MRKHGHHLGLDGWQPCTLLLSLVFPLRPSVDGMIEVGILHGMLLVH
jgi:hypothetical protein